MLRAVDLIECAVAAVAAILVLYLAGLSLLAFLARKTSLKPAARLRRFAVIVPAHNEELSIAKTVGSLRAMDYPAGMSDVIVVADNCTDRTAGIARQHGARVMERTDTNRRGKGYALRWAMDSLLNETPQYDAFVVIDADSVASPSFLGELNGCLDGGASVVQCSDMVEPRVGSWSAEMTRVGFTLYNHARPLGRSLFGGSAGLRGNGMCFDAEVVRSHPWDAYGIAEDLEYGLELLLEGMTVTFAPRARVFATMPERSKNAESQRARWEGGRFPLIRRFAPRLLRSALSRRSFVHLDALIDLVMPPLVNLLLVAVAFALFNLLLVVAGVHRSIPLLAIWIGVIAAGFLHMFVGLYASDADLSQYRAILYLPRYVIWKVLIYARVLRARNESSWVRTTREKSHSGTK